MEKAQKRECLNLRNDDVIAILRQYVKEFQLTEYDAFFLNQRKTRLSEQSV